MGSLLVTGVDVRAVNDDVKVFGTIAGLCLAAGAAYWVKEDVTNDFKARGKAEGVTLEKAVVSIAVPAAVGLLVTHKGETALKCIGTGGALVVANLLVNCAAKEPLRYWVFGTGVALYQLCNIGLDALSIHRFNFTK